ncbi:MAG TPA: type II toxin-antitoxin system VapB family antitoxin [Paracoccus sp. (in: a-proteobacteria)]|nr:type II toxin-antitoxin system VapB family antitoxin [Paracoccus sp. (in: a-proteobacteria)]
MAQIAKAFRSGNSQAVRLPKDFRLEVSEVEISREGDALILRPKPAEGQRWASLRAAVARGCSEDFPDSGRDQPAEQQRPGLDRLFS